MGRQLCIKYLFTLDGVMNRANYSGVVLRPLLGFSLLSVQASGVRWIGKTFYTPREGVFNFIAYLYAVTTKQLFTAMNCECDNFITKSQSR